MKQTKLDYHKQQWTEYNFVMITEKCFMKNVRGTIVKVCCERLPSMGEVEVRLIHARRGEIDRQIFSSEVGMEKSFVQMTTYISIFVGDVLKEKRMK